MPLVAAMMLLLAVPTPAQEEGVFIDPGSPSAKEYAIPLEAERRQADPDQEPSAGIQQGSRSSPIFGTGIVSGGSGEETSSGAPSPAANERDRGARDAPGKTALQESADEDVVRAAASDPGAPDGGAGVPLTIGGVAVGVLLVGGLVGLLLRRRA
jgi:hypothetical protein